MTEIDERERKYDQAGRADRKAPLQEELREIRERCSRLPVLNPRPPKDIIGYDECGLPH